MIEFIELLGAWSWFIAGGVLFILEVLVPGVFMLWLGIAALLVGLISLGVDWPWQAQFVAFAVFSVAAIPIWRRLSRAAEAKTDQPFLNRRAEGHVGRVFTLEKPIQDGSGTVAIDDSIWRITGPDLPAGTRIKIVRVDGTALQVERAEADRGQQTG